MQQLTASERTSIAIARAIAPHHTPARVLVLDEPTANLPGPEVDQLFDVVRRVRDRGIAVIYISHHLSEVLALSDNVTVLRGGRLVTTTKTASIDEEALIELMVGRKVSRLAGRPPSADTPIVLAARNLQGDTVRQFDLDVRAGEVLGVAGITGQDVKPLPRYCSAHARVPAPSRSTKSPFPHAGQTSLSATGWS